ncbi:hypothetical protein GCM10027160_28940 [Streptomyces calidiresistens]|uniref:HK97 gp10 family phage protein n=1 Tax=Streptomyces calidiresistens TaxID=1485586 RepID=A0A7W3T082_9ACTN|nr:hypothetical protein [Streptomyces calidiresistens]MBB0228513.1 hypothetical protein [Streptomyces calidiresistens]
MSADRELSMELEMGREITRVAERLRETDRKLPTRLRAELRKAARPAAAAAKAAVRRMPVKGRGSTGLRRRVARGVRIQASTKIGMRIVTAMPTGEELLPRGLDSQGRDGGWRHPLFGNKEEWVHQKGGSWFMRPISDQMPTVRRNISKVIEDSASWIGNAGGPSGAP